MDCVICKQPVQGRKRKDALVCAGECARQLAIQRTKAWKAKKHFSVREGVTPGMDDEKEDDRVQVSA